ncbi:hypothetical protein QVD17_07229 [Tagetes erecta]|uniref:Uncharacterized protein n=1 Tax=Tagetes erecta TaxID=13708 RepID=A0AAD8PCI0_TARER|nr:hypothetical protein QVD17_07229 [Tagetes erecta]
MFVWVISSLSTVVLRWFATVWSFLSWCLSPVIFMSFSGILLLFPVSGCYLVPSVNLYVPPFLIKFCNSCMPTDKDQPLTNGSLKTTESGQTSTLSTPVPGEKKDGSGKMVDLNSEKVNTSDFRLFIAVPGAGSNGEKKMGLSFVVVVVGKPPKAVAIVVPRKHLQLNSFNNRCKG